jgi:hypothetical protein
MDHAITWVESNGPSITIDGFPVRIEYSKRPKMEEGDWDCLQVSHPQLQPSSVRRKRLLMVIQITSVAAKTSKDETLATNADIPE